MSIQLCVSEWMISNSSGTGLARAWLPRLVAERFATSTRDGAVDRAPDQLVFIDTDLTWRNTSGAWQAVQLSLHRASRTLITSNPNTVSLDDALSWDIGAAPSAPVPTAVGDGAAIRLKSSPSSETNMIYGKMFHDADDTVSWHELGSVADGETVHVRYRCLFSTPGEWRTAVKPQFEAWARWARLRLWASPWLP